MTGESPFLTKPFGEVSIWFFDWTFPAPRSFQIHPNGIQMWRFLKKKIFFWGERILFYHKGLCWITSLKWFSCLIPQGVGWDYRQGPWSLMKAGVGIGLRALVIVSKCSTTELQHSPLLSRLYYPQNWRHGSAVKSTCLSEDLPAFGSQTQTKTS